MKHYGFDRSTGTWTPIPWGTDGLPTYRQIDYWCRTHAIPVDRTGNDSGFFRNWTAGDLARLRIVKSIANDFNRLHFHGLPCELVGQIWNALNLDSPALEAVVIESGSVRITIPHASGVSSDTTTHPQWRSVG